MKFFIGLFAVIIAVIVLWKVNYPSGTWRYKITVEIETPEGIKTGSAIYSLKLWTVPRIFPGDHGFRMKRTEEAVVVDLGKRGILFAQPTQESWQNGIYQAFPISAPSTRKGLEHYRKTLFISKKAEWKTEKPKIVMFTDINDPKSITLVYTDEDYADGTKIYENNFEKIFGKGVKFKGITVEITDEPVTWGVVDKYLPVNFEENIKIGWKKLSNKDQHRLASLTTFRKGENK